MMAIRSLVWTMFALSACLEPEYAQAVEVIVNQQQAKHKPLDQNQLRLIFSLETQTWPDGTSVIVFVLPEEYELHQLFCKQILKLFPYELQRAWDRVIRTGAGQGPLLVASEEEMKKAVALTPGAIGYQR